jgi:prepilin-type N-terminal cleavage/methylation domain-containing protein
MGKRRNGFTLVELMVAVSVVVVLVLLVAKLVDQAALLTTLGQKRMDTDDQARQLLDRMTVDFAQMVRRADIDYYVKSTANNEAGNDQIAFFSTVPGYYPSSGSQSPISLVAYRVSIQNKLERMSKGLVWNAVSASNAPVVFLPLTISAMWPAATGAAADSDYETVGPLIFRFEYAYLLNDGSVSDTPWLISGSHTAPDGMRDVTAVDVFIATIDSKGRSLATDSQITALAASMNDFVSTMAPGDLLSQWQSSVNAAAIPRPAAQGVRFYERQFHLLR